MNHAHRKSASRGPHQLGLSLVELLAGLAIGSVVVVGAVFVYSQSRTTFAVNETVARLQEQSRFVLALIEPDAQLAGYYGFTNFPDDVALEQGVAAADMRQDDMLRAEVPSGAHACGTNFAVDVIATVQGSNDVFQLGQNASPACDPQGGGARAGTDTLTLRRVSTADVAAQAGRMQVYISRLAQTTGHRIFSDGSAPGPITANRTAVRDLVVRTYYISQDSNGRPGFPALRMKTLDTVGGQPAFQDFEIMPGVEDLQVQFGIDTGDYDNDGAIDDDLGNDGIPESNGIATRYVDPDSALLANNQVVAVRLWLRLRAENPEQGFVDDRNYLYANVNYTPAGAEANSRRLLVSRTINLRNARIL